LKRIIVKFYFDEELRFLGLLLALFSWLIGGLSESWILFFLSAIIGSILFSTHYEVSLNRDKKYYKRSLFILGIRFGRKVNFNFIEYCTILKGKYTDLYMVGPFGISTEKEMFRAFIKFSDNQLVQIGKNKNRKKLVEKINFFRFDYGIDIIDGVDHNNHLSDINSKLRNSYPENKIGKDLTILGMVTLLFGLGSLINDLQKSSISYFSVFLILISLSAIVYGIIKLKTKDNK